MSLPPDLSIALQFMTAMIFLTAAWPKMRHRVELHGVLSNYRLLPDVLVQPAAFFLPLIEAAIGLCLLTPWARPVGVLAAAGASAIFGAAMAVNLARGRAFIDCGCFQGTLKQTLRWRLVVRNAVLALLLVGAAHPAPFDAAAILDGILGGAALFFVWQGLNTLWSIVPASPLRRAAAPASSKE